MFSDKITIDPEVIETPEIRAANMLDNLMHKATTCGYLVTDDLLAAFPEAEDNMAQLEEIFIQLINQGIEVYADVEWKKPKKKSALKNNRPTKLPSLR
jgi:hypothetical protein